MRVAAGALAVVAVVFLGVAAMDMARGSDVGRRGWALRAGVFVCFVAAVLLNVLAR